MLVHLYDSLQKKDLEVSVKVECTIPTNDLYVVFISRAETCELMNGKESAPYDEFYYRKLNHIVQGTIKYSGEIIDVTLGFYFSAGDIQVFLINQSFPTGHLIFSSSSIYDENYSSQHMIFNYREYTELQELGLEKLSFSEYVERLLNFELNRDQHVIYNIHRGMGDTKNYTTHKGFTEFLEDEEKKN